MSECGQSTLRFMRSEYSTAAIRPRCESGRGLWLLGADCTGAASRRAERWKGEKCASAHGGLCFIPTRPAPLGQAGWLRASSFDGARHGLHLVVGIQEAMSMKAKLLLAAVLLLFGVIFALQNATVVEVRFLIWSVRMSEALVIFLTGAVGAIIGFLFGTAFKISRQT